MESVTLRGTELKRKAGSVFVGVGKPTEKPGSFLPVASDDYYQSWIGVAESIASELTSQAASELTSQSETQPAKTQQATARDNTDRLLACGCERCFRKWENSL